MIDARQELWKDVGPIFDSLARLGKVDLAFVAGFEVEHKEPLPQLEVPA